MARTKEQKAKHNAIEKKRYARLREGFERLQVWLPALPKGEYEQTQTLEEAAKLIQNLISTIKNQKRM